MAIPGALLRGADTPRRLIEHVRWLAPGLSIGAPVTFASEPEARDHADGDAREAAWLERDGYAVLTGAAPDGELRDALAGAITSLVEGGLPAVFVYLLDETWRLGDRLRARVSTMLGRPYVLAEDGWAWWLPPGSGRGWTAHRDDRRLLDRKAPERVNVWLALTDATAERACIHAVPLDDDPGYPENERRDAPLEAARALPVAAGTALAWNANLLHWGAACAARAPGPRIAVSFTMVRAGAEARLRIGTLSGDAPDPLGRVDMIAGLIDTYRDKGLWDVTSEVAAWASATSALRARIDILGV